MSADRKHKKVLSRNAHVRMAWCAATAGGHPLQTEDLRYGLRVSILGLPAHPLLRTPEALAVVGPAAFGYDDVKYQPLAEDS